MGFRHIRSRAGNLHQASCLYAQTARSVVMAWSVDRLRRSLIDLISGLQELHGACHAEVVMLPYH
jgi:hypothetical protein